MNKVRVVNDRREDRPCFVTVQGMWRPLVVAHKYARGVMGMKVHGVRARYFNQDTREVEEVDLLELLNMEGIFTVACTQNYLSTTYAHIRRANGEELHVQASLICKKDAEGYAEPDYMF